MKYLSITLVLATFSVAGTIPALSRTIHHPTKHAGPLYLYYGRSAVGPLYLYSGGWACQSPASLCAGEASQR
jgi:hypothetical protein